MAVELHGAGAPGCPFSKGVAFDPFLAEQAGEPYPWLEVSRRDVPVFYWPQHKLWCVTRYDDINAILRDPKTYSNRKTIRFENLSSEFEAAFPEGRPTRFSSPSIRPNTAGSGGWRRPLSRRS